MKKGLILLVLCFITAFSYGQCVRNVTIEKAGGGTSGAFCDNDTDRELIFTSGLRGVPIAFVVTDDDGNILLVSRSARIDFSLLPQGNYRVYSVSYGGVLRNPIGQNIDNARIGSLCTELSDEFVPITIVSLMAGEIQTVAGEQSQRVCSGDTITDLIEIDPITSMEGNVAYVVTDENGAILAITDQPQVDVTGAPPGNCRIYGLVYSGDLNNVLGEDVFTAQYSDGCFELTSNAIEVIRIGVDGGSLSFDFGGALGFLCVESAENNVFNYSNTSSSSADYIYIITDDAGQVLGSTGDDFFDFSGAPVGTCFIYGFSYTGSVTINPGENVNTVASTECFALSDNALEVRRDNVVAGRPATVDGDTILFTCPLDMVEDIITVDPVGASNSKIAYVITNFTNNIVLDVSFNPVIDLTNAPEGTCGIHTLSYTGTFLSSIGERADTAVWSTDCYEISEEVILVARYAPGESLVQFVDGETEKAICVGDGVPDILEFSAGTSSLAQYQFIITDADNRIVALPVFNFVDFERAGEGICRIWGLSYTGNLLVALGDTIATQDLTDDCFVLSDNFLTLQRDLVDVGVVTDDNNEEIIYTCPGDGMSDDIQFQVSASTTANVAYVVTNGQDTILEFNESGVFDFEGAPEGICRVYAVAYKGDLLLTVGGNVTLDPLATECSKLSANFAVVIRDTPRADRITTRTGAETVQVCIGDADPDRVQVILGSGSNAAKAYIITDDQDVVLNTTTSFSIDFSQAGEGVCRIYGVSYTGALLVEEGDVVSTDLVLSDDCYDLSDNYVEVTRGEIEGGRIQTADSLAAAFTCPGDNLPDIIGLINSSESISDYAYFLTDINNTILQITTNDFIDMNGRASGRYNIWGASFTGTLIISEGDDIRDPISDGCFDVSSNRITVQHEAPSAGTVSILGGGTEIEVIVGDGEPDIVFFDNDGGAIGPYAYVITDEVGTILGITMGQSADFEGAGVGACRVYGLSYRGRLLATTGIDISTSDLAENCFELSPNFITVNRVSGFNDPDDNTLQFMLSSQMVAFDEIIDDTRLLIIASDGTIVFNGVLPFGAQQIHLSDYGLETGNYYVQLRSRQRLHSIQVFVQ